MNLRVYFFGGLVMLVLTHALAGESDQAKKLTIRGQIVCLDESGEPLTECTQKNQRFGLKTADAKLYRFLPSDPRTAMFTDPRVRERELQIDGWLRDGFVEIIDIHSIKNGKRYDLYYRCEICHITSYEPGPCWCCGAEFEFRETPEPHSQEN